MNPSLSLSQAINKSLAEFSSSAAVVVVKPDLPEDPRRAILQELKYQFSCLILDQKLFFLIMSTFPSPTADAL